MPDIVGNLAHPIACFNVETTGQILNDYFESHHDQEGIVVMDGGTPVGIVMRQDFYQKIGTQYGFSLYMNRSVRLLMKEDFMKADENTEISEISIQAMNRSSDSLYDLIVVESEGRYIGAVSIKHFLIDLARKREEEILFLRSVNERERLHRIEIEKMNAAVRNLLDNVDQGFLSMNGSFIISNQYSRACVRIFGCEIGDMNLPDLLAPYMDQEQAEVFRSVSETVLVEKGPLADEIYLSLLPKELTIENKTVSLGYKVITGSDTPSLMVILTDVTATKELELKMLEERENLRFIVKALSNQYDIISSIESLKEFFSMSAFEILGCGGNVGAILSEIYRCVHTFKGDMGQLHMMHAFHKLHDIENDLSAMLNHPETTLDDIRRLISGIDIHSIIGEDIELITRILGPGYFAESANVAIPVQNLLELEEWASNNMPSGEQAELLPRIRRLRYKNLKEIIRDFDDTVRNVSYKLGKAVDPLETTGDDIMIDKEKYKDFIRSLTHLFRNAADHGLETPEERAASGKPECGRITCTIKKAETDSFTLTVADDGRGIEPAQIRKKALECGLLDTAKIRSMNDREILDLVFADGFTTKDGVSAFSGRGMGLSAVKSEINKLGGDISVETESGLGTQFIIRLPYKG